MSACEQIANLIGAYLYDQLSQHEAEQVENHLSMCRRCRQDVAGRRKALAALGPAMPTPAERDRIVRAVYAAAARTVVGERWGLWIRRVSAATGVCATAAALFLGGMWLGQSRVSAPPKPSVGKTAPAPSGLRPPVAARPAMTKPQIAAVELPTRRRPPSPAATRRPVSPRRELPAPVTQASSRIVAPVPYGVDDARPAIAEE